MNTKAVVGKVRRILAEVKVGKHLTGESRKSKFRVGDIVISEAFLSLRDAISSAVKERFGNKAYVSDFSSREVIVSLSDGTAEGPSYETGKYKRIGYKVLRGEVALIGDEITVERKTTYENKLTVADLTDLCMIEAAVVKNKFNCECIKCGHKVISEAHCNTFKCPKCEGTMRRAGRPGPGQET